MNSLIKIGDASGSYRPVSTTTVVEDDDLEASLVETPSNIPAVLSQLRLEIIAPADLPEGYQFDAVIQDNNNQNMTIPVTVPPGGIEKGQTFTVPYSTAAAAVKNGNPNPRLPETNHHHDPFVRPQSIGIPVGHWRDEICDCFRYGICHPHLWTACFCSARK
jgi:hypothetical protein